MLSSPSFLIACLALANQGVRQGALVATANPLDLALYGPGYFMVATGRGVEFTRDGAFRLDSSGRVVTRSTGQIVLGWNSAGQLTALTARMGRDEAHQGTSIVSLSGNLNARTPSGDRAEARFSVYDALGQVHDVLVVFSDHRAEGGNARGATSSWAWNAYLTTEGEYSETAFGSSGWLGNSRLFFNAQGAALGGPPNVFQIPVKHGEYGGLTQIDFSQIGQLNAESFVQSAGQDGFPPGVLNGISISPDGTLSGLYTNGLVKVLGQFAIATFRNPNALAPDGGGLLMANRRSGTAIPGVAGDGQRGTVASGYLLGLP